MQQSSHVIDHGFLQHGQGTNGPYRTERVAVRHKWGDRWEAHFEGRWRKVHIQVNRNYIVYRGERITILLQDSVTGASYV